ncbi:MAG: hypothetical protein KAJ21_01605 [Thermoplasmatales archaeon]|nr:hypothetical protein [Thermoplasmatales archaeon]
MDLIDFNDNNCLVSKKDLAIIFEKLKNEIINIKDSLDHEYEDKYGSINLPNDYDMVKKIKNLIEIKKKLNPKYIIVIGIGGSNLGTLAIQEALLGKYYNLKDSNIKIFYADTVDSDQLNDIIDIIEPALKKGEKILINCISKSGGTTETISNFEIFIDIIKKYIKEYKKYIIVTTDEDSKFWRFAKEKGFDVLGIPKNVGGRYSIFSSVSLFPLGLIGLNIDKILEGALAMRDICLSLDIDKNIASRSACYIYKYYKMGFNIHDLFLFSPDFESIGKWYRQLIGESIGKEYNKDNKQIFCGITPTVSIGSTDLHSMAQLYLGGPYDKFTTFIKINKNKSTLKLPNFDEYSTLVNNIQQKKISEIMDAIFYGTKKSYKNGKRPFLEIVFPDKYESSIGQFLQYKMIEIMYLGFLLNVNPFDQPNVEDYKNETKSVLEKNI